MIHYMPFTYISEMLLGQIPGWLGPLVIHMPMANLMTDSMRSAEKAGKLQFRYCDTIDPTQLRQTVNAFVSWADLHHGKAGDLAGFFRAGQWKGIADSEPGTRQLQTMIRNWGDESSTNAVKDPAVEAALFLTLAHKYDQQQDALDQDLGSVQALETRFGRILGELDTPHSLGPALSSTGDAQSADRGRFMTLKRIQSWARLTLGQIEPESVLLTTSRAVWTHVLTDFPEAQIAHYPLDIIEKAISAEDQQSTGPINTILMQLLNDSDFQAAKIDMDDVPAHQPLEKGIYLSLCQLSGCTPDRLASWFLDKKQGDEAIFPPNTHPGQIIFACIASDLSNQG